jgi:ABC-type antimicrobial peptide transport system permease subunit
MTHVVRTRSTLDALTIRQVVRDIDPTVPVARIQLMSAVVSDSIAVDALVLSLVAAAAGLAVLVGLVGGAAALSYAIATRRREFGVRLALGATPARLRALVLGRAGVMVGTGILAGAVVAGAASSVMGSMLFGVAALDGSTYIVSAAGLGLAVTITLGVASRGLSKIEPNEALR